MKTLSIIQKLSKIGKILSKIMFIFCIVGFCGCIVGILSMVLGTQIVAEIVYAVMEQTMQGVAPLRLDSAGSVALSIMFIVMSLICRYGAEGCQNYGK